MVPVREELQKYIDKPVYLDNDANCAALGEYVAGAAMQYESLVLVTFGTGIGGGIVMNNKVHSGFNYAGGEIGHIVINSGGVPCSCGRSGCWERYAAVSGLIRMGYETAKANPESQLAKIVADSKRLNGKNIFLAAQRGDAAAEKLVSDYIFYMAEGITNIINILQPQAVVIGGGISNEDEYILKPIREYVKRDVYAKRVEQTHIVRASLGNDAGIIGAAILGGHQ